jgi:hypothetical protein
MRMIGSRSTVTEAVLQSFRRDVTAATRAIPGMADVGMTTAVPFRGTDFLYNLPVPGQKKGVLANYRGVDAGFFRVMRVPLVRGRYVMDSDDEHSDRVAVISQSLARVLFGGSDPIGKVVPLDALTPTRIIGVVADTRYVRPTDEPKPAFYVPLAQSPTRVFCLVARVNLPFEQIVPAIRAAVHKIDPTVPVMRATTIDRIVDESVANRRFYTVLTGASAAIAIVLTLGGLIAVVARVVSERRRELAIRIALGASLSEVMQTASLQSLSAALLGVVVGLGCAYALASGLSQFLFDINARSPSVYVAVGTGMFIIAAIATWHPVHRWSQLPVSALLKAE